MKSLSLLAVLLLATASSSGQELVVRNARLMGTGAADGPKVDLRVVDGKIAAVGESVGPVSPRTPVVDAKGRFVTPAFVLAHTWEGMDRANEVMDVTPFVSVTDAIDPTSSFFDNMLRDGVYTIHVAPGDRTAIGGLGAVVRPTALVVEEMTIVPEASVKISMIPPQGNRAAHMAKIRAALEDARRHMESKERATDTKPTGNFAADLEALQLDRRKAPLVRLLKREIPAFVSCAVAGDVTRALDLEKEFGIDVRLALGPDTWRAASVVASTKKVAVVGPRFWSEEEDPETGAVVRRFLPKVLSDAGATFAVVSVQTSLGERYLWYQAATLIRHGIAKDAAWASVTSRAAEVLGLGASKGSLDVGKDADLLVWTDDPMSGRAWVDVGVSEGRVVYERVKDRRLADLLGIQEGGR
jgi:imidazolonepropionase-like amidohydrolase